MINSSISMRQETIDLACVEYPGIGDLLLLDPGCALASVAPGVWSNFSANVWTHQVTQPMTSIVLTCPEDGHTHEQVKILRVTR